MEVFHGVVHFQSVTIFNFCITIDINTTNKVVIVYPLCIIFLSSICGLINEKFDISQVVFRDIFIFYFHLEGEIISILVSFVITYVTIIIEETS